MHATFFVFIHSSLKRKFQNLLPVRHTILENSLVLKLEPAGVFLKQQGKSQQIP